MKPTNTKIIPGFSHALRLLTTDRFFETKLMINRIAREVNDTNPTANDKPEKSGGAMRVRKCPKALKRKVTISIDRAKITLGFMTIGMNIKRKHEFSIEGTFVIWSQFQ